MKSIFRKRLEQIGLIAVTSLIGVSLCITGFGLIYMIIVTDWPHKLIISFFSVITILIGLFTIWIGVQYVNEFLEDEEED